MRRPSHPLDLLFAPRAYPVYRAPVPRARPSIRVIPVRDAAPRPAPAPEPERAAPPEGLAGEVRAALAPLHAACPPEADDEVRRGIRMVLDRVEATLADGTPDEAAQVAALLPRFDDLERAAASAPADAPLARALSAARLELLSAFARRGLVPISAFGQPFDPHVHEAMAVVPSDAVAPNHVLDVWARGWMKGGRLLRPAQVVVSKATDAA